MHEVLSRRSASSGQLRAPCIVVELSDPIWALCHLGEVLLCGDAQGALFAYSCSQLTSASSSLTQPKPMFCVNAFGIQPLRTNPNEVNTIEALSKTQFVYGGAFDYAVRLVDAERPDKVVYRFISSIPFLFAIEGPCTFFTVRISSVYDISKFPGLTHPLGRRLWYKTYDFQ